MGFEIPSSPYSKKKFNKIALIDADRYKHVVPYRVFQRLEKKEPYSIEMVEEEINDYLEQDIFGAFSATNYIFCFSAPSKDVFRNSIAEVKKYKGNRENVQDKYAYDQKWDDRAYVFTYIKERYSTLYFDDLEADDILSMLQDPSETFIFSHDKDLKQVIGFHWDMEARILKYTDEETGLRMLLGQMISGDTVDNIPGIPGAGKKAMMSFLKSIENSDQTSMLLKCQKLYIEKFGVTEGMNAFAEMWLLLSMRSSRGKYTREKYAKGFELMEALLPKKLLL